MPLALTEIEKGATVCDYWTLDRNGAPVKAKNPARLGQIVRVVYDDGSPEGTEIYSSCPIREIWVRFEPGGKPERVPNQSLILHKRADQTTQFELRHEQNNGLVQDARNHTVKQDKMKLMDAAHVSPQNIK